LRLIQAVLAIKKCWL